MMKHFLIWTLLFVFSFGVVAPNAFAFDCPVINKSGMAQSMDDNMPCHDPANQSQNCEGVCFCLHFSISQAQILTDNFYITANFLRDARPEIADYSVYSFHTYPLLKPPIQIS